jgi:hypothetical protein
MHRESLLQRKNCTCHFLVKFAANLHVDITAQGQRSFWRGRVSFLAYMKVGFDYGCMM